MRKIKFAGFLAAAALMLAACSSSELASTTTAAPAVETTVEAAKTTEAVEVAEKEAAVETKEEEEAKTEDAAESEEPMTVTFGIPKAPPALAVLRMMDAEMLGENVTFKLDVWDAPEQLIAMVQDGNHDMFAFPLTVVSKLHNKGLDVRLTNVNTWGVTYFLTTDPEFSEWSQLKGKTVYIPLQSSPPDALTQFFMNEAGLKVGEDVEIIYSTTSEISQMMSAGKIEYATLIEPQVTAAKMNNENVRVAFSFEDEWKKVKEDESIVPNAGFGTTQRFIDANPGFVEEFEAAYEEALAWVLENPAEAGALAEEHLGLKAKLVEKALPNMGLTYKNAWDAKAELGEFYQLLLDFNPEMIGGKLPDETMYFGE